MIFSNKYFVFVFKNTDCLSKHDIRANDFYGKAEIAV